MLSNCFRDIQVFRYNPQERYIFILAGDNLQILVFPNGIWRFINETEL
ncbi:MAG: glycoside hydrolase family 32 protein [Okeania sp. SIO2H7]|nr:glycoside hydrolase family 32 protein [Okeania sp. SIO2H7]